MIRIAIADDHALLRGGLRQIIATTDDIQLVAEAADCRSTLEIAQRDDLDLLLLDLTMPGVSGTELIEQIYAMRPALPILVLSMSNDRPTISRALKAGATGYATKDLHPEALIQAIRKVAARQRFIDPALAELMAFPADEVETPRHDRLSARELQILQRMVEGQRLNDIADSLHLSPKTVSTYKQRLMEKLGIETNADLIRYALEHPLPKAQSPHRPA
jgi:DNA-binding NarL/FixJ family response regulator